MIVCVAGNPAIDKLFEVDAVRRDLSAAGAIL